MFNLISNIQTKTTSRVILITIFSITLLFGMSPKNEVHAQTQLNTQGYLTSVDDLQDIRYELLNGNEQIIELVDAFTRRIDDPTEWRFGEVGRQYEVSSDGCSSSGYYNSHLIMKDIQGPQGIYEKAIAYHLFDNPDYAITARQYLIELTNTYHFGGGLFSGGNQCILEISRSTPLWISAADLLETTPYWSTDDKARFQEWLSREVFPKVSWASRSRKNNWGSAGSLAAAMIGDYLQGTSHTLIEFEPEFKQLDPSQAFDQHTEQQYLRMGSSWKGDSRCDIWGIQTYGGFPDELRRGSTGCEGQWVQNRDDALKYTSSVVEHFVFHAEFLRRRGDISMFTNIEADGSGSIFNAIMFVIDNPINPAASTAWWQSRPGVLSVSNRIYQNSTIADELALNHTGVRPGSVISYAQLTHALPLNYNSQAQPTPMPTDAPPTNTPMPTDSPPTNTPMPTDSPPTNTPIPTDAPPTNTPIPTDAPPTNTPIPTDAPPTNTPIPTDTAPTNTPMPTTVPPTNTPMPTMVPPTNTPVPTMVPPTNTPVPTMVPPTNTPVPTMVPPTNTPMPTRIPPTAIPPSVQIQSTPIITMSGLAQQNQNQWQATVTITVRSSNNTPMTNASVSVRWDSMTTSTCTTSATGVCTVQSGFVPRSVATISGTVASLTVANAPTITYAAGAPTVTIGKNDK